MFIHLSTTTTRDHFLHVFAGFEVYNTYDPNMEFLENFLVILFTNLDQNLTKTNAKRGVYQSLGVTVKSFFIIKKLISTSE